MEELKPCPFCSTQARYRKYDCMGKDRWTVYCDAMNCPGQGAESNSDGKGIAARLWNQRAKENELEYQLGLCRAELARKDELIAALRNLLAEVEGGEECV